MDALMAIQIGMSIFFGAPSMYVLLSKRYTAREKNWAHSTLGLILGFWLRSKL